VPGFVLIAVAGALVTSDDVAFWIVMGVVAMATFAFLLALGFGALWLYRWLRG
jgi:Kef-type K+ transport system membrane component KefB